MDIESLILEFEKFDSKQINEYKDSLSTKYSGEIFPPYVPHIGHNYNKYKLMMYGMAQSINKIKAEKFALKNKNRSEKLKQLYNAKEYKDIRIAPYLVMLAIAGVYIYAKHGNEIESFSDIHNLIAATNYYKFSLNSNGKDVNPNSDLKNSELYWSENDKLSALEIDLLKPSVVLSFKGRHNSIIEEQGLNVIQINDPSWILQGGGGVLKPTGSWFRSVGDETIYCLVDLYLEQIDGKYEGKKEAIKIYLIKYYSDWKST